MEISKTTIIIASLGISNCANITIKIKSAPLGIGGAAIAKKPAVKTAIISHMTVISIS